MARSRKVQWVLCHLRPQMLNACRQIDRRCLDVTVSHHARETVNIAASFKHECRERVPQFVRAERNARRVSDLHYEALEAAVGISNVVGRGCKKLRTAFLQSLS